MKIFIEYQTIAPRNILKLFKERIPIYDAHDDYPSEEQVKSFVSSMKLRFKKMNILPTLIPVI